MSKPSILSWNTTYLCNLACSHCYASAKSVQPVNELTTEEAINFIESLSIYRGLILVFSGGEPLTRPDIYQLIETATENKIRPVLGTNGTLLKKNADKLKKAGIKKIGVSLDSSRASRHDTFRGVEGAFKQTLEGIRFCHDIGIGTQIHTTISDYNLLEIEDMVKLAESIGSDAIHIFFMVPTGRAARLDNYTAQKYENLLEELYNLQKNASILIKPVCAPQYLRVFSQKLRNDEENYEELFKRFGHFTRFRRGCLAGYSYARIDPFGNVTPCPYMELKVGSIRETPFPDIWENSQTLINLRTKGFVKGKCSSCDYLAVCGGGCRARAYSLKKRIDAAAPSCLYTPISA